MEKKESIEYHIKQQQELVIIEQITHFDGYFQMCLDNIYLYLYACSKILYAENTRFNRSMVIESNSVQRKV